MSKSAWDILKLNSSEWSKVVEASDVCVRVTAVKCCCFLAPMTTGEKFGG